MRVLGVGMLVVTLLAAGLAAFRDGEGLTPSPSLSPEQTFQLAGDGGSGVPPTPAP